MNKTCKSCKKKQTLECFYNVKGGKHGVRAVCKQCVSLQNKQREFSITNTTLSRCTVCGKEKQIIEFSRNKRAKSGVQNQCKLCQQASDKQRRDIMRDQPLSEFPIKVHSKKCIKCQREKLAGEFYRDKYNSDGLTIQCKQCKQEYDKKYHQQYYQTNKEARHAYTRYKRSNDVFFKLRSLVAVAICESIKQFDGNKKGKHVWDKIGYSLNDLKYSLESKFESWMTWENHGRYDAHKRTWQIDHITPQAHFPFDNLDHPNFQKCWSLDNLRPLETMNNMRKGRRINACE